VRSATIAQTSSNADGSFVFRDVPEGSYIVQVGGEAGFQSTEVNVLRHGAMQLSLLLKPLRTARGRVLLESDLGASNRPDPPYIAFVPTDFTRGPIVPSAVRTQVTADGEFELTQIASPGMLAVLPTPGWALSRILLNGRDITHTPYDFGAADVSGLEVIMTTRVGGVTGTVRANNRPLEDASVFVFGAAATTPMYLLRTMQAAKTDAQGRFRIGGLVPGRYLVSARTFHPESMDIEALMNLRADATQVTVTERADTSVALVIR
jgi:hypothetical protein